MLTYSAMLWRCCSTCPTLPLTVSFSSVRTCCVASVISCLNCAVTVPVHELLLRLPLLLRTRESPLLAPFAPARSAPLPCQMKNYVVRRNLSQRGCVSESVTSAEDRCALSMGEAYMQIDAPLRLGPLCDTADRTSLRTVPAASDVHFGRLNLVAENCLHPLGQRFDLGFFNSGFACQFHRQRPTLPWSSIRIFP